MKVIVIKECDCGIVGVANNYKNAIKYLIKTQWLAGGTSIYDKNENYITVEEYFGQNWIDKIINLKQGIKEFNSLFEDGFRLYEEEVFEG